MSELVIPHSVNMAHYEAGAIVFACLDDRFHPLFEELVESLKRVGDYAHVDRVVFAGGAKDLGGSQFSVGSAERRALLGQIEKSVQLHRTPAIVATTHEDCGAYGERATRGSRATQYLFHVARHGEIEREVLFRFPRFRVNVKHFYLSAHGAIRLDDLAQTQLSDEEAHALKLDQPVVA